MRSIRRAEREIEIVANDDNLCGEGPYWDERELSLYWTDIPGRRFYRFLWQSQHHELLSEGCQVAGFARQEDGFLVTNHDGIWLWSPSISNVPSCEAGA
jgi:sugar lactone lactonase YvrE